MFARVTPKLSGLYFTAIYKYNGFLEKISFFCVTLLSLYSLNHEYKDILIVFSISQPSIADLYPNIEKMSFRHLHECMSALDRMEEAYL